MHASPTSDVNGNKIFVRTYHVNNSTDNLVNLSSLGCLGGHITSSEGRKGGLGGLEGITESGSPEIGADPPSRSKSSNPAKHNKKALVSK
jgi:hypothetical protein